MASSSERIQFNLLIFIFFFLSVSSHRIPRLGLQPTRSLIKSESVSCEWETYFYNQTLDHFSYTPQGYSTFKQKYGINTKYWGGGKSNSPIFVFLGGEGPMDHGIEGLGFLPDNAPHFKALQVYIEHRFYGESIPFGFSIQKAVNNKTIRGYFNSAQALADYAEVIMHLKNRFSAENSPVIVTGGSYSGMLATWFRLKYPHIVLGALASSAPILYFEDITPHDGYYSVVTKDFKEVSESCYKTIRSSWAKIKKVASRANGLQILTRKFKSCLPLKESESLKYYLEDIYTYAAQYNFAPTYTVDAICQGINGAHTEDILDRIFAGVVAFEGIQKCYPINEMSNATDESAIGWSWQYCSEMMMPIGCGNNDTMFPAEPFDQSSLTKACERTYGVAPRPHWITTYYGGHDIKRVLKKFASNIIFSNGLKDPFSIGGILEDISDSLRAVNTVQGSHGSDMYPAHQDDPEWLVNMKKTEVKIIEGWITQYNADLRDPKE